MVRFLTGSSHLPAWCKRRSEANNSEAWDASEVAEVASGNRVAEFQGARADDKVGERQIDSSISLLTTDPRDDFRGGVSDGIDG